MLGLEQFYLGWVEVFSRCARVRAKYAEKNGVSLRGQSMS